MTTTPDAQPAYDPAAHGRMAAFQAVHDVMDGKPPEALESFGDLPREAVGHALSCLARRYLFVARMCASITMITGGVNEEMLDAVMASDDPHIAGLIDSVVRKMVEDQMAAEISRAEPGLADAAGEDHPG